MIILCLKNNKQKTDIIIRQSFCCVGKPSDFMALQSTKKKNLSPNNEINLETKKRFKATTSRATEQKSMKKREREKARQKSMAVSINEPYKTVLFAIVFHFSCSTIHAEALRSHDEINMRNSGKTKWRWFCKKAERFN
jgi:hypothetical protein